jgi:hypothetical protein
MNRRPKEREAGAKVQLQLPILKRWSSRKKRSGANAIGLVGGRLDARGIEDFLHGLG